ncbi:MAG: Molybdopterin biosynthesis protein MoeA [Candidatus Carbobacillus altaicus]|uniref:Molybdopterin molybdenumtransferase n=1 Tax=Candidatus Carbonibacillus altaicus TaxID=2163959 RepID=A0A2R6Y1B4_9BACL|nr:MAG: Molybdopterin biosynthesis protein MoeA [Candidatus Carbobacillus altaicus]
MDFMHVVSVDEALGLIRKHVVPAGEVDEMVLEDAAGYVLAEDIVVQEDLPAFARATVDGYALRAHETVGASDSLPAFFDIAFSVAMGEMPERSLRPGEAAEIPTGGMLPDGADAVVMIEHVEALGDVLNVYKQVAPGENVIQKGEDYVSGSVALRKGTRLGPAQVALLAGVGKDTVRVYKKPKLAVLSTGDEIVPVSTRPLPLGKVRDMNGYSLTALFRGWGAEVTYAGIIADDFSLYLKKAEQLVEAYDGLILSGASSVGQRDWSYHVLRSLPESTTLFHGLAIRPGKPTMLGLSQGKPILGLPGHPASAMVIAHVIGRELLYVLKGDMFSAPVRLFARVTRNLASQSGRTDYVRVRLVNDGDELWAEPQLGKSGLIYTLAESDGLLRIPPEQEGLLRGAQAQVMLYEGVTARVSQ